MLRYVVLLLAASAALTGYSQDTLTETQRVQSPSLVKRDRPIKVNHPEGAKIQAIFANVSQGVVSWSYLPEDHFERTPTFTIFVAPPGDYFITTGDSTIIKIVEEGGPGPRPDPKPDPPPPDPKPDPKPDPNPQPSPKLKVNWAVWIYEQSDAMTHIAQTNTRLSIETRRYLESRGIKMAGYDDEQDAAQAKPFREAAGKLPSLVLMQDASKYVVRPAPSSVEELKKIMKEVTGE